MIDPMTCDTVHRLLSGYLDGELSPTEAGSVARHVEGCAACRAEYQALSTTSATLRELLPALVAPELLRSRITAQLRSDAAEGRNILSEEKTKWLRVARQIAAGLVIAAVSSLGTRAVLRRSSGDSDVAVHEVVATHVRSLMTNHLTDIVSTDEHNVKPWFDGKVPFAPTVPRLDSTGFPLIGGRVDTIGHHPVAALVYGRRKHLINVFTWPAPAGRRGDDEIRATEHGYNVVRWVFGDMQFAAVSDLADPELREFVAAFRQRHVVSTRDSGQRKR